MRALLSVWDKTGLVDFARGLSELGVELVATGDTSRVLAEAKISHLDVADVTGFPEILDGRVKTLHPKIHGGILADRDQVSHVEALSTHEITSIDLVVSNLYPFASDPSIELIDIGGPAMVRAAAKNHRHVGVLTSPSQYEGVLSELREHGELSSATRHALARAAFSHTSAYDAEVVEWLDGGGETSVATQSDLPPTIHLAFERVQDLRYGENPHQRGARYRRMGATSWWDSVHQHAGTALSYLNIFDADAAWRLVHELVADVPGRCAVAIMKHANAAGAALDTDPLVAYQRALAADPLSAFGGIVAVDVPIDSALAALIAEGPQADVIVAPYFSEDALATLIKRRKATRLLAASAPEPLERSLRSLGHSLLVQGPDELVAPVSEWRCVTTREPSAHELEDLCVAWRVCARTTSNAIVIAKDLAAVGVGAGQQSRVVSAQIAIDKAAKNARGASAASDAFFPFADGLEALVRAGVTAIVQPGGSVRDDEVTAAANEAGVAMMMTGERHFRH